MFSQLNHFIVMLSITILGITSLTFVQAQTPDNPQTTTPMAKSHVSASYVCMVDNEYKDSIQLSVIIDDNTYYGCCQPCIDYLQTDKSIRYAKDPFSNAVVNKSNAYIAIKNDGSLKVHYFESELNYKKFYNPTNLNNE